MAKQGSPLLRFSKTLCSEQIGTPGMTLYYFSFTCLLFEKSFLTCIANKPINKVLQERFL